VINSQQQQTSTPYNPNYHHHHYANPYQNLSPIGPPPAGSIFSGISADNSFLFGDHPQTMTGNVQKMPHFTSPQSLPQNQGQFFSQLQQQQVFINIYQIQKRKNSSELYTNSQWDAADFSPSIGNGPTTTSTTGIAFYVSICCKLCIWASKRFKCQCSKLLQSITHTTNFSSTTIQFE
jgi:hypothetical protein